MARRKTKTLTELELDIMQVVWTHDEVSVEFIQQTLDKQDRPLALPSVRTMLGILQDKGYVTRRRSGRGHVYRAAVREDQAKKRILSDVIERVFEGSAENLVAALVSQGMVDRDDLDKARKLIRQAEKERGK